MNEDKGNYELKSSSSKLLSDLASLKHLSQSQMRVESYSLREQFSDSSEVSVTRPTVTIYSYAKVILQGKVMNKNEVEVFIKILKKKLNKINAENDLYELYLKNLHLDDLQKMSEKDSYSAMRESLSLSIKGKKLSTRMKLTSQISITGSLKSLSSCNQSCNINLERSINIPAGPLSSHILQQQQQQMPEKISLKFRFEMIHCELANLKRSFESNLNNSKILKQRYEAEIVEAKDSLYELMLVRSNLENSFDACGKIQNKFPAKKYVMIVKGFLKSYFKKVNKLGIQVNNLEEQLKQVNKKIRDKKIIVESASTVDIEELKVQIEERKESLKYKHYDVHSMERIVGKCNQDLIIKKRNLDELIKKLRKMNQILAKKEKEWEKLMPDYKKVDEELIKATQELFLSRDIVENYKAPSIMDLARKKAILRETEKKIKKWNRRTNLQKTSILLLKEKFIKVTPKKKNSCLRIRRWRNREQSVIRKVC